MHTFRIFFAVIVFLLFSSTLQAQESFPLVFDPPLGELAEAIIGNNPLARSFGLFRLAALQRNIFIRDACNLRLCFALGGSDALTSADYELQKNIVKLIASVTAINGASFSAAQYGLINDLISERTLNADTFRTRVDASVFQDTDAGFIGAGLGFCISNVQMVEEGDGRTVILLGDGRGQFADTFLEQVLSALGVTEEVLAVGVGKMQNVSVLTKAVGGNAENVYSIGMNEAVDVTARLVRRLCRLDR